MLLQEVDYARQHPEEVGTLVIDTADWAEKLCIKKVCDKAQKEGIEDFGWGKGYVYVQEEFGRLLNKLSEVIEAGINVVVTAHAQLNKVEQPDEMGSYDRWELKLTKKCSPMLKEWADLLLFANYKTIVVNTGEKKYKGQGGQQRIMYTTHTASWDAKNRFSLLDVLPFDYKQIESIIESSKLRERAGALSSKLKAQSSELRASCHSEERSLSCHSEERSDEESFRASGKRSFAGAQDDKCFAQDDRRGAQDDRGSTRPQGENGAREGLHQAAVDPLDSFIDEVKEKGVPVEVRIGDNIPDYVPKALADLMREKGMTVSDIESIVTKRGYFPAGTPFQNYPPDFISGCLIDAFPQLYDFAVKSGLLDLPF